MKKAFIFLILMVFSSSIWAQEEHCEEPKNKGEEISNALCLFSRPLLVGASITKGLGANAGGPAALIAKSLNPETEITNLARSGTSSVISLRNHQVPAIPPSIVVGVDLFFWDAARKNCGDDFEERTKKFIKLYQDLKIPMILGKLPTGVKFPAGYSVLDETECTGKINKLLEVECTAEKNCLLYDPKDCFNKLKAMNLSTDELKKYFVDDLHTSVAGNKFCANIFVSSKSYQSLACLPAK